MCEGTATEAMKWTGERMVPEGSDSTTFWEHVYRYRFASRFVRGKRVVDVACGEGYGAHALLLAGAKSVVGFDIDQEACEHARRKYGIDVQCADATALPIPDGSADLVVSFETVEHIARPEAFVQQCARILTPSGKLIISTPDKETFSEDGKHNEFHCSEMTRKEFQLLLSQRFDAIRMYSQRIRTARPWQLASLAATHSSWLGIRGFWRFRRWVLPTSLGDGAWGAEVSETGRMETGAAILRRDAPLVQLFNSYDVRPLSPSGAERAKYMVAVCMSPKP